MKASLLSYPMFAISSANSIAVFKKYDTYMFRSVIMFVVEKNLRSLQDVVHTNNGNFNIEIEKTVINKNNQKFLNTYLIITKEVTKHTINAEIDNFKFELVSLLDFLRIYKIKFKLLSQKDQKSLLLKSKFNSEFSQLLPNHIHEDYQQMLKLFFSPRIKIIKQPPPTPILHSDIIVGTSIEQYDVGFSEFPVLLTGRDRKKRTAILRSMVSQLLHDQEQLFILDFGLQLDIKEKHKIRKIGLPAINCDPFLFAHKHDPFFFTKFLVYMFRNIYQMSDRQVSLLEEKLISYISEHRSSDLTWKGFTSYVISTVEETDNGQVEISLEQDISSDAVGNFLANSDSGTSNHDLENLTSKLRIFTTFFYGSEKSIAIPDLVQKPGIVYVNLEQEAPNIKFIFYELFNLFLFQQPMKRLVFLELENIKSVFSFKHRIFQNQWLSKSYKQAIIDTSHIRELEDILHLFPTLILTSLESTSNVSYRNSPKLFQSISRFLSHYTQFNVLLRRDEPQPLYFKEMKNDKIQYSYPPFIQFATLFDLFFNVKDSKSNEDYPKIIKQLYKEKWIVREKNSLSLTAKSRPLLNLLHKLLYYQPDMTQAEIELSITIQEQSHFNSQDITNLFTVIAIDEFFTHLLAQQFKTNMINKFLLYQYLEFVNGQITTLELVKTLQKILKNSNSSLSLNRNNIKSKEKSRIILPTKKDGLITDSSVQTIPAPQVQITPILSEQTTIITADFMLDENKLNALTTKAINAFKTINERLDAKFEGKYSFPEVSVTVLKKYIDETLKEQLDKDLEVLNAETNELMEIRL